MDHNDDHHLLSIGVRVVGAVAALATAYVHIRLVHEYFQAKTWLGTSFVLVGVAMVAVAAALLAGRLVRIAWAAGAAVAAGTSLGFLLSRSSTGLFGFSETEWGVNADIAMTAQVVLIVAAGLALGVLHDRHERAGSHGAVVA